MSVENVEIISMFNVDADIAPEIDNDTKITPKLDKVSETFICICLLLSFVCSLSG